MLTVQPVSMNTNFQKVSFQRNDRQAFEDDREFFEYAKNNQSERNSWIRDFIRNKLSSNDVNFSGALQACQNLVFRDAYPDDYAALGQKLTESLEKKNGKIKKRLEELGYDVHGEKLQGEA